MPGEQVRQILRALSCPATGIQDDSLVLMQYAFAFQLMIGIAAWKMKWLRPWFSQVSLHMFFQAWMNTRLAAADKSGVIDVFDGFRLFQCFCVLRRNPLVLKLSL